MKRLLSKTGLFHSKLFLFCLSLCFTMCICPIQAHASDLDALIGEDAIIHEEPSEEDSGTASDSPFGSSEDGTASLMDAIKQSATIKDDSVKKAAVLAAPIVSFFNLISAVLLIVLMGWIGVVTVCDLIFVGVPTLRPYMHPMYNQVTPGAMPAGGGMTPMGGGFGGFGSRYGYGGGGMAMGAGMQQQAQQTGQRHQWVSDEAFQCIGLSSPQPQQQMGMPMGMGMGMAMQQPQQPLQGKSVIFAYLKKRTFFLVFFAFSAVFLTSSILTGFGLKLFSFVQEGIAKWL